MKLSHLPRHNRIHDFEPSCPVDMMREEEKLSKSVEKRIAAQMGCGHPVGALSEMVPDFAGDTPATQRIGTVHCRWCADLAALDTALGENVALTVGMALRDEVIADLTNSVLVSEAIVQHEKRRGGA